MPLGAYMLGTAAVLVGDLPGRSGRGPIGTSVFVRVPSEANGTSSKQRFYGYLITVVEDKATRARLWALADRVFPAFAGYRDSAARAGRTIPILQLLPR